MGRRHADPSSPAGGEDTEGLGCVTRTSDEAWTALAERIDVTPQTICK